MTSLPANFAQVDDRVFRGARSDAFQAAALVKRAGGKLVIPVAEVDDTGGNLLMFSVDPVMRTFNFEVRKKQ